MSSLSLFQFKQSLVNMGPVLKLIVAQCNGGGIGIQGQLPWRIKAEMKYFAAMTTSVTDTAK